MVLGFLSYEAGVEGPGEILHNVNRQESGAVDDLHRGSIDDQWRVMLQSPEVNSHLCCFVHIQREVANFLIRFISRKVAILFILLLFCFPCLQQDLDDWSHALVRKF